MKEILTALWSIVRFIIATILMTIFGVFFVAALLVVAIGATFAGIGTLIFDDYDKLIETWFVKLFRIIGFEFEWKSNDSSKD